MDDLKEPGTSSVGRRGKLLDVLAEPKSPTLQWARSRRGLRASRRQQIFGAPHRSRSTQNQIAAELHSKATGHGMVEQWLGELNVVATSCCGCLISSFASTRIRLNLLQAQIGDAQR
ncbi:hypothetical protein GCT13_31740 [Paraburkholderia sp. CNPSo 3157]|uniref:Uncharacterized protein n=1 Tax=Paraburkholderia franconis TaxID=2654983 RepID=A0A7X1TJ39_9BURK|nr:hypothetical protein [Paraburkholderia franconis]MPW21327.1 hypothetical protein [Paraburkholderia franconis]